MKYIILVLVFIIACNSHKTINDNNTNVPSAPVIVYKMSNDYFNNVPITLSQDKSVIVSYPHPTDLKRGDKYSTPTKLKDNYRWHLFFSAYFKALTHNEEFAKIINLSNRYALVDKEKQSIGKARYLPILYWHQTVARYMEGDISAENLKQIITESGNLLIANNYKQTKVKELFNELSEFCPRIFKSISKGINF